MFEYDEETIKYAMYAADKEGNIFLSKDVSQKHPDLLQGKYGMCAGNIAIKNGKITYIDVMSGHYKPTYFHLLSLLNILDEKK